MTTPLQLNFMGPPGPGLTPGDVATLDDKVAQATTAATQAQQAANAVVDQHQDEASRARTASTSGRYGYAGFFDNVDGDITAGYVSDGFYGLALRATDPTATTLHIAGWLRAPSVTDVVGPGGATSVADTSAFATASFTLSDLGLTAGGAETSVSITLPKFEKPAGYALGVEIWYTNAAGTRVAGGVGYAASSFAQPRRWLWFHTDAAATTWGDLATGSIAGTVRRAISIVERDLTSQAQDDQIAANSAAIAGFLGNIDDIVGKLGAPLAGPVISTYGVAPAAGANGVGTNRAWGQAVTFSSEGDLEEVDVNIKTSGTFELWMLDAASDLTSVIPVAGNAGGKTWSAANGDFADNIAVAKGGRCIIMCVTGALSYDPSGGAGAVYCIGEHVVGDTVALTSIANINLYVQVKVSAYAGALEPRVAALEAAIGGTGISAVGSQKRRGTSAIAAMIGRCERSFDNSTPCSFKLAQAHPAPFHGVSMVAVHASGVPLVIPRARIAALSQPNDLDSSTVWSGGVDVTWNGAASVTLPGLANTNSKTFSLVESDVMPLASIARTDGQASFLIGGMVDTSTAASLTTMGDAANTDRRTAWVTQTGDEWISRWMPGSFVASPAGFTSTTNRDTNVIGGFRLLSDGISFTVLTLYDSTGNGEGDGITPQGGGFGHYACGLLNARGKATYAHLQGSWSGTVSGTFLPRLRSILSAGLIPDICFLQVFSPNDFPSGPITLSQITLQMEQAAQALYLCERYGIEVIVSTGLPANTTVKPDWGASDSLRETTLGNILRAMGGRGRQVADFGAVVAGAVISGQRQYADPASVDKLHPSLSRPPVSTDGVVLMAKIAVKCIDALELEPVGNVFASAA